MYVNRVLKTPGTGQDETPAGATHAAFVQRDSLSCDPPALRRPRVAPVS